MRSNLTELHSQVPLCRYLVENDRDLVIEEYSGRVDLEQLKDLASQAAIDPRAAELANRLVDFGKADLVLTSDDALRFGLLMRHEFYRTSGWQLYVSPNPVTFSIVRMLSHWARTTDRTQIFRSRAEAENWLQRNIGRSVPGVAERHVA